MAMMIAPLLTYPPMPSHCRHVVHLVYRFAAGGLENVVVQLINHLPHDDFRHTVVAIAGFDEGFVKRIERPDVEVISLDKGPGQPFKLYPKVFKLLRRLRPDVLHSCNLAAMEFTPVAALAGVPLRVHVEHGLDIGDLGGGNAHYKLLRKAFKPFVNEFVAVAAPLRDYLANEIGVSAKHLHLIPNGVDTMRFRPRSTNDTLPDGFPFVPGVDWVIGYVGRMVDVKNPLLLVQAFINLAKSNVPGTERMRLAMVGAGALTDEVSQRMQAEGLRERLWLPGVRTDVAEIFRAMDCFVLPSLFEATSCTLQEAMATGLRIVATDVGGNADLLEAGRCGTLVRPQDPQALASAILLHFQQNLTAAQPVAAMAAIHEHYDLATVINRYRELFRPD